MAGGTLEDPFAPRFFVIWDRADRKFKSITLENSGMIGVIGASDIIVTERAEAAKADDLVERLNKELGR